MVQISETDYNGGPVDEPIPESKLWRSVLLQVLQDGTVPSNGSDETSIERVRTIALVCATTGVTAEDFDDICFMAGINADLFRREFFKYISTGNRFVLRNDKWTTRIALSTSPSSSKQSVTPANPLPE